MHGMENIRNSETIFQMLCGKNTDHWSWGWISYSQPHWGCARIYCQEYLCGSL